MSEVTRILSKIEQGNPEAADELLPLVYEELRKLAASKLAIEKPGQTLQATALVHEAYLRLVNVEKSRVWDSRGHFFAAAAESMRRILVESARRKQRIRHGGEFARVDLEDVEISAEIPADEILAVNEALDQLESVDEQAAKLTKLRYFAGMTVEEAAELLGIPARTAYRNWNFARAWIFRRVGGEKAKDAAESSRAEKI